VLLADLLRQRLFLGTYLLGCWDALHLARSLSWNRRLVRNAAQAFQRMVRAPFHTHRRASAGLLPAVWGTLVPGLVTDERVVTEQDTVAVLWVAKGTHLGEFDGVPPTGRRAHWEGITMVRVACGLIAEVWTGSDGLGLRQQLGIITDEELLSVEPTAAATPGA